MREKKIENNRKIKSVPKDKLFLNDIDKAMKRS